MSKLCCSKMVNNCNNASGGGGNCPVNTCATSKSGGGGTEDCCSTCNGSTTTTTTTNTDQQHNHPQPQPQQQQQQPRRPPRQPTAVVSLNARQLERLRSVLDQDVQIHGRENFPTLEIPLHALIVNVRRKLRDAGLPVKHVKMNGGAASFAFASSDSFPYSDIDLIFPMELQSDQDFERVREAVFAALLEMMPSGTNKQLITTDTLRDVYIRKMVKITDGQDRWSLFSLHNDYGRCIELKFVERMRRQFEFSVDSFQITLDPLIDRPNDVRPVVRAESMYGDFLQALFHLNKRLIDTRNPEEIRGGGLLKYCHLLTRDYTATQNCRDMEKYMCSRFFIDFPDISVQEMKLLSYLQNHFGNEDEMKLDYLHRLLCVIKESTVCLMYHERRQTLSMVDRLRQQLSYNMMLYYPHTAAAAAAAAAMYNNMNNAGGHYYGGGGNKSRRYSGNNNNNYHHRNWQNNRNNGTSGGGFNNNRNGSGAPHLVTSSSLAPNACPVSPVPSSSLSVVDEQQQHASAVAPQAPDDAVPHQHRPQQRRTSSAQESTQSTDAAAAPQQRQHKAPEAATASAAHVPRQTLLYLPPNANQWIPVV